MYIQSRPLSLHRGSFLNNLRLEWRLCLEAHWSVNAHQITCNFQEKTSTPLCGGFYASTSRRFTICVEILCTHKISIACALKRLGLDRYVRVLSTSVPGARFSIHEPRGRDHAVTRCGSTGVRAVPLFAGTRGPRCRRRILRIGKLSVSEGSGGWAPHPVTHRPELASVNFLSVGYRVG